MFASYNKPRSIISCLHIINSNLGFLYNISRNISNESTSSLEKPKICSKNHSFTVSYLINNIGLSPQVAIANSEKVKFESVDKPDSVVTLFREHGFDNTHISKIIAKCPELLKYRPNIILLPKLKFLSSIGASSDDIASNPYVLELSLDKRIVPFYEFCKSILLSDEKIVCLLRTDGCYVLNSSPNNSAIVELLKEVGVSKKHIGQFIYRKPRVFIVHYDRFKTFVDELLEMKFDPSKALFVVALSVRLGMTDLTWAHKIEVYKRWGWTEHEILSAFRKYPVSMSLSEGNIMSKMDFLVNEMGFQSTAIAKTPVVLTYSLESRLIPRCSVVRVLQMKGLISEDLSLLSFSFLVNTEQIFVDRFIIKYEKNIPQLLTAYQSKVGILELGES